MAEPTSEQPEELVLELRLAPGENLSGSVRLAGEGGVQAFSGWIDFMTALNALRDAKDGRRSP